MATVSCLAGLGGIAAGAAFGRMTKRTPPPPPPAEMLHWQPGIERRGCGDLITKINHIGLTVSDVGRSLSFYTEVIGFQQIQRPNFDRHGAWLTMGNLELHLIKGVPIVHSGTDLIVSHLALETDRPDLVLEKLLEMNIPFRQNVSVPDPKKARENLSEDFSSADGKVTQFFVRDPDGYYLELCNCDILTKFCLFKEKKTVQSMLGTYTEGRALPCELKVSTLFKVGIRIKQLIRKARDNLMTGPEDLLKLAQPTLVPADEADENLVENLVRRQNTYADITQGFSEEVFREVLQAVGNSMPLAILTLKLRQGDDLTWRPPAYLMTGADGKMEKFQPIMMKVKSTPKRRNFGTFSSKAFEDVTAASRSLKKKSMTLFGVAEVPTPGRSRGPLLGAAGGSFAEAQFKAACRRRTKMTSIVEGQEAGH